MSRGWKGILAAVLLQLLCLRGLDAASLGACSGPGALINGGFEGPVPVRPPAPPENYLGGWTHLYNLMPPATVIGGPDPVPYAGLLSYEVGYNVLGIPSNSWLEQDICIDHDPSCPIDVCIWTMGDNNLMAGILSVTQKNLATGTLVGPTVSVTSPPGDGSWYQLCVTIGGTAYPFLPGADAINISLKAVPGPTSPGNAAIIHFDGATMACSAVTGTATVTSSPTDTVTASMTFTPTATYSLTSSPSSTPTNTGTDTPTPTATITYTSTLTPTAMITYTSTITPTVSETPSHTSTASNSPSVTATPSANTTDTMSPTLSATATWTLSPSPSLTVSPSASVTPSSTVTLTASPSASFTVSLTPSPTFSNTATFSFTPSVSPTFTSSPVRMPFKLTAGVYNSAGERVKMLFQGSGHCAPVELRPDKEVVSSMHDPVRVALHCLLSDASTTLIWDGSTDAGQMTSTGIYHIKMEVVDPFGKVTSLLATVQRIETPTGGTLSIYNEAGELIYRAMNLPAQGRGMVHFKVLGDATLVLSEDGVVQQPLKLSLNDNAGSSTPWSWDGRNARGEVVAGGTYYVQIHTEGHATLSQSFQVLRTPAMGFYEVVLAPNPAGSAGSILFYQGPPRATALARVYNLAGELVQSISGGGNRLHLVSDNLPFGIYFVVVEIKDGGMLLNRRVIKWSLLR